VREELPSVQPSSSPPKGSSQLRLAYLASRYPAVTHTFIAREVAELRRLGIEVETISVREAEPDEVLCDADRREHRNTHVLVPPTAATLLKAHGSALVRHPRAYLATLSHALRLSAGGFRAGLWQLFYFAEAILLWRHCGRRRIEHVHVHFANVGADVAMLAARFADAAGGRRSRLSWSFTMHSHVSQHMDGTTDYYDVVRHRLRAKVEDASFVACVSDFERSMLMSIVDPVHWPKLHLVRCGVDVREFAPPVHSAADDGRARILAVGRLLPLKGHALLLEAAARLRAEGSPVEITIVGNGPQRERLERLTRELGIERDVTFAGAVGRDMLPSHYSAADIFCLPSFAEGVPVVLMEAMAAGLPVVATRVAGIPELVRDGESGLLVSPGRADLLAAALRRLVEYAPLRRRMGDVGSRRVADEFEVRRCARRLLALMREAQGAPRVRVQADPGSSSEERLLQAASDGDHTDSAECSKAVSVAYKFSFSRPVE
jgi:colanic acid/amylovoran biosynthesis glycosyltransferase